MDRQALIADAHTSISRGSKSFAIASRLFTRETRERAWLLYAWCRACDDLIDGQDHGGVMSGTADPMGRLAIIRDKTAQALRGEAHDSDIGFAALAQLMAERPIPHALIDDLMAGFALDAEGWRPETTDDLMRYCYHVAGSVGCMMAIVMGVDPRDEAILVRACDLGLAFQLANIARDIAEDAAAGRCYLPGAWLREQAIDPADPMAPQYRPVLAKLAERLADLAARHEASARSGTVALPFRSAWAVLAAAGIYGAIAQKVRRAGPHAWDKRQRTGRGAKLALLIRAAVLAAFRKPFYRGRHRDAALWRPRFRSGD